MKSGDRSRCGDCGYRSGTLGRACPECGGAMMPIEWGEASRKPTKGRWARWSVIGLIGVLAGVPVIQLLRAIGVL